MTDLVTTRMVRIDRPTWAVLSSAAHCEGGCGRLVFPAVEQHTGRRMLVEMAADEDAHWTWTYPDHTAKTCRDWRAVADIAMPMICDRSVQ